MQVHVNGRFLYILSRYSTEASSCIFFCISTSTTACIKWWRVQHPLMLLRYFLIEFFALLLDRILASPSLTNIWWIKKTVASMQAVQNYPRFLGIFSSILLQKLISFSKVTLKDFVYHPLHAGIIFKFQSALHKRLVTKTR